MGIGTHADNRLLSGLPPPALDLIERHLRPVTLAAQAILYEPGVLITKAYFPLGGAISLVIVLAGDQMVETAMVGRDDVVGGFAALCDEPPPHRAIVQIAGAAAVIDIQLLRHAARQSEALRSMLLGHVLLVLAQSQHAAACNATHTVEARLCRWLLRARNACGSSTLAVTQESIAELLGVRRTSISAVAHGMQQAGLIRTRRGRVELIDLVALQKSACECYAHSVRDDERLLAADVQPWNGRQIPHGAPPDVLGNA